MTAENEKALRLLLRSHLQRDLQDRRRIAHALHDHVLQNLFYIVMAVQPGREELHRHLPEVLEESIRVLREVIDAQEIFSTEQGLGQALDHLAALPGAHLQITVENPLRPGPFLEQDLTDRVFTWVRLALGDAEGEGARQARIELEQSSHGGLRVVLHDDRPGAPNPARAASAVYAQVLELDHSLAPEADTTRQELRLQPGAALDL